MPRSVSDFADRGELLSAFANHVSPGKVDFYRRAGFDVVMGRREGSRFHDAFDDARSWFNCHSNGGVFNLGHRNPALVAEARAAFDDLDIGNHHLVSGWRGRLAERLARTTENLLERVVFGVSGGESIDLAVKVARGVTSRRKVISVTGGYHGHTGLALAAGDAAYRDAFGDNLPDFVQVPFNDLDALELEIDDTTAAVLVETVPATLGMPIPHPNYLPTARALTRDRGALLVLDEVQTGLGRTGRFWGYQVDGVVPDMVVTGKGLSGGLYPITATLMTRAVHSFFDTRPFIHISTFGGAEIGCRVALAVLDVIEAPGFLARVTSLSDRFARGFDGAPFELRRRGLMMGLRFPMEGGGMFAAKALYDAGVFAVYANNDASVLQFLPPLTVSDAEANEIIAIVRRVFG